MYSTYKQYWEAREQALDDAIEVGGQLRDASGVRDGVGRELKEAEGVAPPERVTELREDYTRKEGRVEELQQEFGDAQAKLSAIELDAAGVDPNWAASLEEGIAPDGSRQSDKPGKLEQLKSFIGDMVDAARDSAEAVTGRINEMVDTAKDGAEKLAGKAGEMVDTVKEGAGEVADQAKELYERAKPTLNKVKEGAELAKEVWEGVEPAVKAGLETTKMTLAAGGIAAASFGSPADSSGDLLQQMENPTAGVQAAVQEVIHEQAQMPGVPLTFVSNLHEAPKGPEEPDYPKQQQDYFEVQQEWDKEQGEQDLDTAAYASDVAELVMEPPTYPKEQQDYLEQPKEGEKNEFQDLESGGLGSGPSSYASTDGPEIPSSLLELNEEPPPPPPPPPPEEDPHKGLGH